jgi:hypothetical protein
MPIIHKQTSDIRNDASIKRLISKLPENMKYSFNDEQLESLKPILDQQVWKTHPLDIRFELPFFRKKIYFVFLAGQSSRWIKRKQNIYVKKSIAFMLSIMLIIAVLFAVLVLYLLKSSLGIDLIPGVSFGLWDWFWDAFH